VTAYSEITIFGANVLSLPMEKPAQDKIDALRESGWHFGFCLMQQT
jgi:hypothetical protein